MSRIGRMPIAIPAGVTVDIAENNLVTVKGPKEPFPEHLLQRWRSRLREQKSSFPDLMI